MKTSIVLLTGAILTSTMFAAGSGSSVATDKMGCAEKACCWPKEKARATGDPWADERFKMKFGRHTPAEDARQKAAQEVYAKNMKNCTEHGCAHIAQKKTVAAAMPGATRTLTADPGFEERFRMKFGRVTTAERLQQARKSENPAPVAVDSADRSACGLDCCNHGE